MGNFRGNLDCNRKRDNGGTPTFLPLLQFALVSFTSIFVLVDPVSAVPAFIAMTAHPGARPRRKTAAAACWTFYLILTIFAIAGPAIFRLFGITLPAFKIAGGIVLGLVGLDMLQARRSPTKETPGETEEGAGKEDPGVIPLGIPMLAGPGSISSVMVLMGQVDDFPRHAVILGCIAAVAVASFVILAAADKVGAYLHQTGIQIMNRMMGLLLTAIAVQFVLNGLRDIGVVR